MISANSRIRSLRCVLIAVLWAICAAYPAQAMVIGVEAPALNAAGVVEVVSHDQSTTKPLTLIFSKSDDAHTEHAIEAIGELYGRYPHLHDGTRTIFVLSRINGDTSKIAAMLPPDWGLLHDTEDTLYTAYHIIATPTVVIVGTDNRVVGFHPGYNAGLAQAMRRDLMVAIDGPESLTASTPTPGIMDIQMARQLARRKLWDRSIEYYRKAAAVQNLPCDIALEEVAIHLEIGQPDKALELLEAITNSVCAVQVAELGEKAQAMADKKSSEGNNAAE